MCLKKKKLEITNIKIQKKTFLPDFPFCLSKGGRNEVYWLDGGDGVLGGGNDSRIEGELGGGIAYTVL